MNHSFTRIASLVLAFGFFIACSSTKTNIDSDPSPRKLSETQLEQRIDAINKKIAEGDSTADLLYRKGLYLTELAQKKTPASVRTPLYTDASAALKLAARKADERSSQSGKARSRELLNVTWSNEHNRGVQLMQADSSRKNPQYLQAAAHFKNATAVIPDSAISYKMGARAYYRADKSDRALAMLEEARSNIESLPPDILEQLAYLYLQNGRAADAVATYEQAESFSRENLNLLHGLSNAYISAGNHREAVTLLQTLVEEEPDNKTYRQSLATELYYLASEEVDQLLSSQEEEASMDDSDFQSVDSLLARAEKHFSELRENSEGDADFKERLAQFYHNGASKYQKLQPRAPKDLKTTIESRIEDLLSSSLPLLEDLVRKYPDQKQYWKNLYQAYSYLGMSEKANNAKSNF